MEGSIIGNLKLVDSKIDFDPKGHDNYVYCDNTRGEVILEKTTITFKGSNSVIFLFGGSKKSYKFKAFLSSNTSIYIGLDALFHKAGNIHLMAGEGKHLIIGNESMVANDIWIRTGDAHPVYSTLTHQRINNAQNVVIGDHVWLAQECMVFKGAIIGSGAIFGARSIVTGKTYFSNTSYVGAPARMISEEGSVFFDKMESNFADAEKLEQYSVFESDKYIYRYDKRKYIVNKLLTDLENAQTAKEKIEIYKNMSKDKNRFAIDSTADIL